MTDRVRAKNPPFSRLVDIVVIIGMAIGLGALASRQAQIHSGRGHPRGMPSPDALQSGYEPKDLNARDVSYILLAIGIVMMVVIGAAFAMVRRYDVARRQAFADLTSEQTAQTRPPAPHLQTHPAEDLARLRLREDRELHRYGWTSADHSTAEIPIERAMVLMVGRPLSPVQ